MNAIITVVGRLGQDPKNQVVGDQEKAYASLGVSRDFKKSGAQYPETDWFNFEVWGKSAQALMQHAKKGKALVVTGRPEFYKDSQGNERFTIRSAAWSFAPQDSKGTQSSSEASDNGAWDDGSDIPF